MIWAFVAALAVVVSVGLGVMLADYIMNIDR